MDTHDASVELGSAATTPLVSAPVDPAPFDPASTIVVATGNAHKLVEVKAILSTALPGLRFAALHELGDFADPEETGESFAENALIKARFAQEVTGCSMAVADDSGLCVDALEGAPGVMSARWAGVHGDDAANNAKMLRELAGCSPEQRRAHFHSSVVLVRGDEIICGNGDCPGYIGFEPKGTGGFGYDPLFYPDATPGRTMAELTPEEKNRISHRFFALQDLSRQLAQKA